MPAERTFPSGLCYTWNRRGTDKALAREERCATFQAGVGSEWSLSSFAPVSPKWLGSGPLPRPVQVRVLSPARGPIHEYARTCSSARTERRVHTAEAAGSTPAACTMVAVAQQVRAPGCGPGGRRFKAGQPPHREIPSARGNRLLPGMAPDGAQGVPLLPRGADARVGDPGPHGSPKSWRRSAGREGTTQHRPVVPSLQHPQGRHDGRGVRGDGVPAQPPTARG